MKLLRQVGEVATRTARRLFSHLVVTRLHLEILVADEDAARGGRELRVCMRDCLYGVERFFAQLYL